MSDSPERMPVVVQPSDHAIAQMVAGEIAQLIRSRNAEHKPTVLGLATGSTPIGIYQELIRLHRDEKLDFSRVVTFNLDEYFPMSPESIHSYHRFMWENLFSHINIKKENVHIPRGDLPREDLADHCAAYEQAIQAAGGIDYQILGIGQSGHIGFNEPGSSQNSRTRLVSLDSITRRTAAGDFFGEENVPLEAVTMGVASIMDARRVALLATGEHKAAIIRRAVEGPISPDVAATHLQRHANATVYLDAAAAAMLTRFHTPWVMGEVEWDRQKMLEAVVWLSQETKKSVLKLASKDYRDHHLGSLLTRWGSAGAVNGEVFNILLAKIRGKSKLPCGRRILVFSPHPDDDVISAGGILRKLFESGNDIQLCYQTSGNIAVFDHEVMRYMDFLRRLLATFGEANGVEQRIAQVEAFLASKQPGDVDVPLVQEIKRDLREAEAVSAIQTFGMKREQAHFLNLPFYQTGQVKKDPVGPADVRIVLDALEKHRPLMIFAAGDFTDPHGTHRVCLKALEQALAQYKGEPPEIWLYRGAWQEWPVHWADALVPMSEEELRTKIMAIFKHQSQKDKAPFPGMDEREFWQRVEERNKNTAEQLNRLGLPDYFAMEAYVIRKPGQSLLPDLLSGMSMEGSKSEEPAEL